MIVVADTSPINYLVLIGQSQILADMFGQVIIPEAVLIELSAPETPEEVRQWLAARPSWLIVRHASSIVASLADLELGEQEAISLATELSANLVVIDDYRGRQAAQKLGLSVTGTLGVLVRSASVGLLNLRDAIDRLRATTFHASPNLLEEILHRYSRDES